MASGFTSTSDDNRIPLPDRFNSFLNFENAYFSVEGDPAFTGFAGALLTSLGNPYCTIAASEKTRYHAACVMVSNLVNALAYTGTEILKTCGLDDEFAESAWRALFLGNAENIAGLGPAGALTGPVERGDTKTVAAHLDILSGEIRDIYLLLSRLLTKAAAEKNPDRDYSELLSLLRYGGIDD